jgi:hypothetical protein
MLYKIVLDTEFELLLLVKNFTRIVNPSQHITNSAIYYEKRRWIPGANQFCYS